MDQARFQEAQRALESKDYRAAAEGFLTAAGGPGGPGNGEAYHLAGNALMKLRKYQHAATVYQHALRDTTYPKMTAVLVNLATAQAALGAYDDALLSFNAVLADPTYPKRYKALQGRAGALFAMGRYDEAARDYIAAAEPGNPDRGRAFNNLGLTLAAAGRTEEAVEAYKAAIATENYTGKGKASANLGLAYAALGRHSDAVASFDAATGLYAHVLSDNARAAYEAARAVVDAAPRRQTVEGWETGEMPIPVPVPMTDDAAGSADPADPVEAGDDLVPAAPAATVPSAEGGVEEDSAFFTRTEGEMKEIDRQRRREERSERRSEGNPWARAGILALVVVALVAAFAGVFFAGYGYPTQQGSVSQMLDAYHAGRSVGDYWVAAPAGDVDKEMSTIPPNFASYTVDRVERSAFTSKVSVTVKLQKGAPLRYTVSLSREGVGWKVMGIDNDWGGAGGS